jgi:hypothetical protein
LTVKQCERLPFFGYEEHMKTPLVSSVALLVCVAANQALAMPIGGQSAVGAFPLVHLVGNTSSNSSSNTSSNSSAGGSSYVHTHHWSVDSHDGHRHRSMRGVTRIERYWPGRERYYRRR